jgi:arylsulfatase A-like enzyme
VRRLVVVLVGVALGGLLSLAVWYFAGRTRRPPDVILVTVDTVRADRLGAYGYPAARTPNIDRLAARGTLFTSATTPFPRTTPALASLLTGLWPHHHGSREVGEPMRHGTTLATLLAQRGYFTIALSATVVATPRQGLQPGFHLFEVHERARAPMLTERAVELARAVPRERPLFLWIHYFDPHFPYDPPLPQTDRNGPCLSLLTDLDEAGYKIGHVYSNHANLAGAALEDCRRHYDLEIAFTDSSLGTLFTGLGSRFSDAIVVFTSDHGEHFGEEGLFYEHGPRVHEAVLRVPLIVAGPGLAQGQTFDGVARLEDVMPTVLDLTGTEAPPGMPLDGLSLAGAVRPRREPETGGAAFAFAESGSALQVTMFNLLRSGRADSFHCLNGERFSLCGEPGQPGQLYDHVADPFLSAPADDVPAQVRRRLVEAAPRWRPEHARSRSVRTPRFKLVEQPSLEGYVRRLYDLAADPGQTEEVSAAHPEVAARLGEELTRWSRGLDRRQPVVRDEEDVEALRTLGYIED